MLRPTMQPGLLLLTLLCTAITSLQIVDATTITVTNTNDGGAGSLRQALAIAQSGDTIAFEVTGRIILVSAPLNVPDFKNINIRGPGATSLLIDGNVTTLLFSIGRSDVSISDLTITNGDNNDSDGGAIRMLPGAKLTLSNCVVSNSVTSADGGAIVVNGSDSCDGLQTNLTLNYCTVSGNSASGFGGAIASVACGQTTVTINNCTISGNEAGFAGGALYNDSGTRREGLAKLIVNNSTISDNSAHNAGGAIENDGDTGFADVIVSYCTITGNEAPKGDSISTNGRGSIVTIHNTILNASSGQNIAGRILSLGYNLSNDNGGGFLTHSGDQINTDPLLSPLQNNGGPTLTHALLPGSPAIDRGNPLFHPPPAEDQRGCPFDRLFNGRIDVGAFEFQPTPPPCPTPRSRPTPGPR